MMVAPAATADCTSEEPSLSSLSMEDEDYFFYGDGTDADGHPQVVISHKQQINLCLAERLDSCDKYPDVVER